MVRFVTLSLALSVLIVCAPPAFGQSKPKLSQQKILIVGMKGAKSKYVKDVAKAVETTYGVQVEILKIHPKPSKKGIEVLRRNRLLRMAKLMGLSVDEKISTKSLYKKVMAAVKTTDSEDAKALLPTLKRNQWSAMALVDQLKEAVKDRLKEKGIRAVIGVTHVDISVAKNNFVFGKIGVNGAIVSYSRLSIMARSSKQLSSRVKKQALYVGGWLLGVYACEDQKCARRHVWLVLEVDKKPESICQGCRDKLNERWDTSKD